MSTQESGHKVQHLEALKIAAADVETCTEELERAVNQLLHDAEDARTDRFDETFSEAMRLQDKIRRLVDTDVATAIDGMRTPVDVLTIDECAQHVLNAYSILRTVSHALGTNDHSEFIGHLTDEISTCHSILADSPRWKPARDKLPQILMSVRVLALSIDDDRWPDERESVEVAENLLGAVSDNLNSLEP